MALSFLAVTASARLAGTTPEGGLATAERSLVTQHAASLTGAPCGNWPGGICLLLSFYGDGNCAFGIEVAYDSMLREYPTREQFI